MWCGERERRRGVAAAKSAVQAEVPSEWTQGSLSEFPSEMRIPGEAWRDRLESKRWSAGRASGIELRETLHGKWSEYESS